MTKTYFSSTTSIDPKNFDVIGCIENATSYGVRTKFIKAVGSWCLDSGGFTKPFVEDAWKKRVDQYLPYRDTCSFIVVPDVVYDYKRTLDNFHKLSSFVKEKFPLAFVTQDGISIKEVPWSEFDVLFIGGSNDHKLGKEAKELIWFANNVMYKRVHVGRVNSIKRIAQFNDCSSWDGTHLGFYPPDADKFASYIRTLGE